jgi:hypothetical protein
MSTDPVVFDPDARRLDRFIMDAIVGFLNDPPDSDFQTGYLAALTVIYREGLRRGHDDARLLRAEEICKRVAFPSPGNDP